jgi:Fe-coproporphyrin III synthase
MNLNALDVCLILTYRCNARCSMCNVWKHPSIPADEISLREFDKIPYGVNIINLTGGEPTLRSDFAEIVDLLYPRTAKLEISSNGLRPEKIYPLVKKYPDIRVRFSLDGFEDTSNQVRGEPDGFQTKVNGLRKLQELGGTDLGFAITIQDENADQLVRLFDFAEANNFELATSTIHNGFQFHKADNVLYDRLRTAGIIEELITAQLRTMKVKNWFRAYLNLGIVSRVLGHDRLLPCSAGTNFLFIDPWGDMFACNVRPDLKVGNLACQTWDDLVEGPAMQEIRRKVAVCQQNCWMVGSAKTAMRHPRFSRLPRLKPFLWVAENKLRVTLGGKIPFQRYIDHSIVYQDRVVPRRVPYDASPPVARQVQRKEELHYVQSVDYDNR